MPNLPPLNDDDRARYEWQMWTPGFGEEGQQKLKGASVLISRAGGVGGTVAYELAAAGIGKIVIAHAGETKPSDLNRQLLMTTENMGKNRADCAAKTLIALNPTIEVVPISENISDDNAERIVSMVDVVVDCAPLFPERYAMNAQAVAQGKPMVECAMYDFESHLTTIVPGQGPCLRCLYPEAPPYWKREFPVFGGVSGTVACLAAVEVIKVISGLGQPLIGRLLQIDMRDMTTKTLRVAREPDCAVCGSI
jgi:molybdopterin/thiamine biosynthesis adenylyltransferase